MCINFKDVKRLGSDIYLKMCKFSLQFLFNLDDLVLKFMYKVNQNYHLTKNNLRYVTLKVEYNAPCAIFHCYCCRKKQMKTGKGPMNLTVPNYGNFKLIVLLISDIGLLISYLIKWSRLRYPRNTIFCSQILCIILH